MITLVVEASTYHGSAALLNGGVLLAQRSVAMRGREHEALMPAVAELLSEAGIAPAGVGRVVCGAGPGSFTSLRIAASIAKGMALATGASLVPVSSLALLVASVQPQKAGRYVAAVDAMRGESYAAIFFVSGAGELAEEGAVRLVKTETLDAMASEAGAFVVGPGRHGDAQVFPHAASAARITNVIDATDHADLAAWEPGYGRLAEAQVKWESEHGRPLQS
ncbi:MAG: tRNA (adenosine(37)-N6)-threonylcarbamoyltransferase complex dimerization subunit type 1 TsaB [Gemmatimonadaceae bacterium]